MKLKTKYLRIQTLFVFLCLSFFVFAQTKFDDKKLLQGKWVLEDTTVLDGNDTISINLDSIYVGTYTDIEIRGNAITVISQAGTLSGTYEAGDVYLYVDAAPLPAYIEWAIFENKLYLGRTQDVDALSGESKVLTITSVYRRK